MKLRELQRDLRFATGVLLRRPFHVLVQVTNRCNMRCSFCDFWPNGVHPREELTVADYERISLELSRLGMFLVSVEGGEPLLRPDLPEIVAAFSAFHFPMLYTNGWYVDADVARRLWDAGLHQVGVSIDFPDAARHDAKRRLKGGYDQARRAVETLKAAAPHGGTQVHVITVLMRENQHDLEALLELSAAHGVKHHVTLLSTRGFRRGKSEEDHPPDVSIGEKLLELHRRYPHFQSFRDYLGQMDAFLGGGAMPACQAGSQSFNIDHVGNVAPCIEKIDRPAGNLCDEPLPAIVARMRDLEEVRGCQDCWSLCRGVNQNMGAGGSVRAWWDMSTRMRSY